VSHLVQGTILYYRTGIKTQKSKECIIQFTYVNSISKTGQLIGRKVVWNEGEKKIMGKIVGLHGRKGLVRVRFRKGVPGQALGTSIELIEKLTPPSSIPKEAGKKSEKTKSVIPTPPIALTSLEGVGTKRAEKLKSHGVYSAQDLVKLDPKELSEKLQISEKRVKKWVDEAKELLNK
jgi:large subunit ribosomal protein L35Ae